jgi:hypothetical protein
MRLRQCATVPGEIEQRSGDYSLRRGEMLKPMTRSLSGWTLPRRFSSTANNQFLIRAAGGVGALRILRRILTWQIGDLKVSKSGSGIIFPGCFKQTTAASGNHITEQYFLEMPATAGVSCRQ